MRVGGLAANGGHSSPRGWLRRPGFHVVPDPLAGWAQMLVEECPPFSASPHMLVEEYPPSSAPHPAPRCDRQLGSTDRHASSQDVRIVKSPKFQYEHPTQHAASTFLRAVVESDAPTMWTLLSRETRGLLEGLYAARAGVSLKVAAGVESDGMDERLGSVLAPLRASVLVALGEDRIGGYGVSNARLVDRGTAYVLLLPDFGDERVVSEADWKPSHLLAFVYESREWLVDLGKTADLSADAGLPDPLGGIRR